MALGHAFYMHFLKFISQSSTTKLIFDINLVYNLAKFLVPILTQLTNNDYAVNGTFNFAEEVSSFDQKLLVITLDVESFSSKILLN